MKTRSISNEADYIKMYGHHTHLLPYEEWSKLDNWQTRNHYLNDVGKFLSLKTVTAILGENYEINEVQVRRLKEFWDIHPYPNSENTKRNLAYFIKYGKLDNFYKAFKRLKELPQNSIAWWKVAAGDIEGARIFADKKKKLCGSTVPTGRASKESARVLANTIQFLKDNNIDYFMGEEGNREYIIYDYCTSRRYMYDLCIPAYKLIIEYHGECFHPRPTLTEEEWAKWKCVRTGDDANTRHSLDVYKRKLAEDKKYKMLELWSTDGEDTNSQLALDAIKSEINTNLFNKTMIFTDIHFGLNRDSDDHNINCLKFIDWMIEEAQSNNVDTCIFMGDYFHCRSTINTKTMDYGYQGMRKLSNGFNHVIMIVGNHDMTFKNNRSVHSLHLATVFDNITVIDDITDIKDCTFVPFLVQDEWKELKNKNPKYYFGHFELPGYKLNSLVEMPDHGKETDEMFHCDTLFSGHFHKRQMKLLDNGSKIIYIGNCFPHNFGDAWDDARGCVLLEWDKKPIFKNWPNAPKYRTANISDILEDPTYYLGTNISVKATLDVELTVDELIFIKETYSKYYNLKDFNIIQSSNTTTLVELEGAELQAESVDTIVAEQINNIDSNTLEKSLLLEIYNSLGN